MSRAMGIAEIALLKSLLGLSANRNLTYKVTGVAGNVATFLTNNDARFLYKLVSCLVTIVCDATAANRVMHYQLLDYKDTPFFHGCNRNPTIASQTGYSNIASNIDSDDMDGYYETLPVPMESTLSYRESLKIDFPAGVAGDTYEVTACFKRIYVPQEDYA